MRRIFIQLAVIASAAVWSCAPAWAGATIHVGTGADSVCATGGCPLYNGETNPFGDGVVDLYQNAGGAGALQSPVLLILAVPNDTATGLLTPAGSATIGSATVYAPYPTSYPDDGVSITFGFGTSNYGLDGNGYQGLMTSDEPNDIYGLLGLTGTNASNNFGNLAGWDLAVDGIVAANFGIYVYALNTNLFDGKALIDVTFAEMIPQGTFAVGYGVDSNGKTYSTPFTEAGLNDDATCGPDFPNCLRTPEPATLALFGAGLLGLGIIRRRKYAA